MAVLIFIETGMNINEDLEILKEITGWVIKFNSDHVVCIMLLIGMQN